MLLQSLLFHKLVVLLFPSLPVFSLVVSSSSITLIDVFPATWFYKNVYVVDGLKPPVTVALFDTEDVLCSIKYMSYAATIMLSVEAVQDKDIELGRCAPTIRFVGGRSFCVGSSCSPN